MCGILIRKYLQKIYLALIFILLYAPIVTLIVLSFNQSKTRAKWGGFTLKWYQILLHNSDVVAALQNTLTIGFASAAIATDMILFFKLFIVSPPIFIIFSLPANKVTRTITGKARFLRCLRYYAVSIVYLRTRNGGGFYPEQGFE